MNFTHRQIHQSRLRRRTTGSGPLVVLVLTLLTGCNGGGALDQRLDDYLQRLARSLGQTLLHAEAPADLKLPRPRALQIPLETASLNMLEFVELSQCELHRVIAARNSSLGKLAVPSQDLLQQLDFLKHVDSCLALISDDHPALAEKLRRAAIHKQQALPTYLWRATLGGAEFRAFWGRDSNDTDYPANADSRTDFALTHLNQMTQGILDGNYEIDAVEFHEALAVLRNQEGGALQHGWSRAHVAMDSARRLMTERLDRQPLCYPDMVNHQARIFRTVITDYFVKQVQPLLAALNRRYYDIMPRVRQLETRLASAEPEAYRDYRQQRDTQLDQAHASVAQHIRQAAPLLAQCGFLPSVDS